MKYDKHLNATRGYRADPEKIAAARAARLAIKAAKGRIIPREEPTQEPESPAPIQPRRGRRG